MLPGGPAYDSSEQFSLRSTRAGSTDHIRCYGHARTETMHATPWKEFIAGL